MSTIQKIIKPRTIGYIGTGLLILFFSLKAWNGGNDINVYLHASRELWYGNDIYASNPFNDYLYSPLFAMLMWPLAFLPWEVSRMIWALLNLFIIFRLWKILSAVLEHLNIHRYRKWWHTAMILASAGFIIHNLNLGQITVLILWMTLEGILLILRDDKPWRGAFLLALGMTIKIIPVIALGYLFLKGKLWSILYTVVLTGVALLLPILFLGVDYNKELLVNWKNKINPSGEKYVFENNVGAQSLNALLPAYFYEFPEDQKTIHDEKPYSWKIAHIPYDHLIVVVNILRILFLLSVIMVVFLWQSPDKALNRYWQLAYLMLISLIVFPHQMKYSMLYFVPAVGYLLAYFFYKKGKVEGDYSIREKIILALAGLQVFVIVIMGRDIIGDVAVDFLDYFHFMGVTNVCFAIYLLVLNPGRLTSFSKLTINEIK